METFHGGYYVNVGQLEFKKVELGDENSEDDMKVMGKKKVSVFSTFSASCE